MNSINSTSLPMCGFIAQLVESSHSVSRRSRVRYPVEALAFFFLRTSSFQLLKLENLLAGLITLGTIIYNRSIKYEVTCVIYTSAYMYIGLFERSLLPMSLIQVALKQATSKLRTPVSMYQLDPI